MHCLWYTIFFHLLLPSFSFDCKQLKESYQIKHVSRHNLMNCLAVIGRSNVEKKYGENIWRLIKEANDGIENVSPSVYKLMGNLVAIIPIDDLRNVSMDRVDMIEAFNSIGVLTPEQIRVIHDKVKTEWANKTPESYSQYDLISLGQILCYFNQSEILAIHADAYKAAAEEIGKIRNCPQDVIRAFAKLAIQPQAFGHPSRWSKLEVSVVGNIITGLTPEEYSSINVNNLTVNRRAYNQTKSNNNRTIDN